MMRWAVVASLCMLVACGSLEGFVGGTGGDGGLPGSEGGVDASDTGAGDADTDTATSGDASIDGDAGSCARFTKGPTMVLAGRICIDSTEITNAQYSAFLTSKNGDTSGQPPECSWNATYAPASMCPFDPTGKANFPV